MKATILNKDGHKTVKLNRRKAIHERCLSCSGWYPKELASCFINDCPLHSFRTGRGKQNAKARKHAIRTYCIYCVNGQIGEVNKCPSRDCPLFIYRKGGLEQAVKLHSNDKIDHIEGNFLSNAS